MKKKNILSKFNFKDYNNEVEEILEKKSFSSDVKNLLLSMFYKVEVAYKDYAITKRDVTQKDGFLESIIYTIKEQCDTIELINPTEKQEDILAKNNVHFITEPKEKKIISYFNEQCLFHAIIQMSTNNFYIEKEYEIFEEPLQEMLKKGYELDKKEIITNFDGWSWNINIDITGNSIYNLIYQNLRFLMGNNFLYEWKRDRRKSDYIRKLRQVSEEMYIKMCNICVLLVCQDEIKKEKIIKKLEDMKLELKKLENKNELLQEIYESKRVIKDKIKMIDKLLNNKDLLEMELKDRNKKLPEERKILSVSTLEDILEENRKGFMKELQEFNNLLDPKNYIKKVNQLKEKIELIENLPINDITEKTIYDYIISLQKTFLNCIKYAIDKIELKKDIIEFIYKFRYYKFIPLEIKGKTTSVQQLPEIKTQLEEIEKEIITKACKEKAILIINQDIEYNYKIISKIMDTKIIDMENIVVSLQLEDTTLDINIYDKEIIDKTDKIDSEKPDEYNVKLNKKFKLFI